MKLVTKQIEQRSPAIGTTGEMKAEDIKVVAKFFHPLSGWTWYMTEYDPEDRLCFGFVVGFEAELGYFSMDELEEIRVMGLGTERDLHFGFDHTLASVMRAEAVNK